MARIQNEWRKHLLPSYFHNQNVANGPAVFHVESASKENGRRIVTHEFPKKDLPYAEDMGRRAIEFSVRGYCIAYPWKPANHGGQQLPAPIFQEDYTIPRDILLAHLEAEGPGVLQLPLLPPMRVVCSRYRLTEEQRLGGYCTFDMSFVELGAPPFRERSDGREDLIIASERLRATLIAQLESRGGPPGSEYTNRPLWHPAAERLARTEPWGGVSESEYTNRPLWHPSAERLARTQLWEGGPTLSEYTDRELWHPATERLARTEPWPR